MTGDELISDADTEEALAEFDFLVSVSHDGAGEARSHADTDWGTLDSSFLLSLWQLRSSLCNVT